MSKPMTEKRLKELWKYYVYQDNGSDPLPVEIKECLQEIRRLRRGIKQAIKESELPHIRLILERLIG